MRLTNSKTGEYSERSLRYVCVVCHNRWSTDCIRFSELRRVKVDDVSGHWSLREDRCAVVVCLLLGSLSADNVSIAATTYSSKRCMGLTPRSICWTVMAGLCRLALSVRIMNCALTVCAVCRSFRCWSCPERSAETCCFIEGSSWRGPPSRKCRPVTKMGLMSMSGPSRGANCDRGFLYHGSAVREVF